MLCWLNIYLLIRQTKTNFVVTKDQFVNAIVYSVEIIYFFCKQIQKLQVGKINGEIGMYVLQSSDVLDAN